jgi:hypothetical protein
MTKDLIQLLEHQITVLDKQISDMEQNKDVEIEMRNRQISIWQHKKLCKQTRIDLLHGKSNHDAFLETNNY